MTLGVWSRVVMEIDDPTKHFQLIAMRRKPVQMIRQLDQSRLPPRCFIPETAESDQARICEGILEVPNWLSNRIFRSHDNVVDHYCHAWKTLQSLQRFLPFSAWRGEIGWQKAR